MNNLEQYGWKDNGYGCWVRPITEPEYVLGDLQLIAEIDEYVGYLADCYKHRNGG